MKNRIFFTCTLAFTQINNSYCVMSNWDNIKKTFCIQQVTDAHPNEQVNLALTFLLCGFRETGPCIQSTRMKQIEKILCEKCNHIPKVIQSIILSYCPSPDDAEKELCNNEWYLFEEHIGIPMVTSKGSVFKMPEVYKKHLKNTFVTSETTFQDFISLFLVNLQRLAELGYASNPYQYHLDKHIIPGNCNYCEEPFPITPISPRVLLAMPKDHAPDFIEIVHEPSLEKITCKYCNKGWAYLSSQKFAQYPTLLIVTADRLYEANTYFKDIKSKKHLFNKPFTLLGALLSHKIRKKTEKIDRFGFKSTSYLSKITNFIYQHCDEEDPCHVKSSYLDFNDYSSSCRVQAALYRYTNQ